MLSFINISSLNNISDILEIWNKEGQETNLFGSSLQNDLEPDRNLFVFSFTGGFIFLLTTSASITFCSYRCFFENNIVLLQDLYIIWTVKSIVVLWQPLPRRLAFSGNGDPRTLASEQRRCSRNSYIGLGRESAWNDGIYEREHCKLMFSQIWAYINRSQSCPQFQAVYIFWTHCLYMLTCSEDQIWRQSPSVIIY